MTGQHDGIRRNNIYKIPLDETHVYFILISRLSVVVLRQFAGDHWNCKKFCQRATQKKKTDAHALASELIIVAEGKGSF